MAKWVCSVCGYVHEGDTPPEKCPMCGVPAEKFNKQEEGEMEWIDIDELSRVNVVEDFHDLLKVINDPELTEFQYTIEGDEWITHLN